MDDQADARNHTSTPFFSILVLCWNSQPHLRHCLLSLAQQNFKDFEVLLVDNGSSEPVDPHEWDDLSELHLRFFRLSTNLGFAAGNNFAAKQASGEYLVLLNSDAFPQPDWLQVIHSAALEHPDYSFASRLVMVNPPDRLDGEGDLYHASGLVWRRSYGKSIHKAGTVEREVFSPCGAAAAYPRTAFDQAGGFDEQFFAYVEDVDLGFRLRLSGHPCLYLPTAVVNHVGSASTGKRSDLSVYYGQRNLVWTFAKDMPSPLIWLLLPGHILANLFTVLLSLFRRQGVVTLRAKWDAIMGLRDITKKRREVQQKRTTSFWALMRIINWNPFSP